MSEVMFQFSMTSLWQHCCLRVTTKFFRVEALYADPIRFSRCAASATWGFHLWVANRGDHREFFEQAPLPIGVAGKILGVRKIFLQTCPKFSDNSFCEYFLPHRSSTVWDDVQKKVFMWFSTLWAPFFPHFKHFAQIFRYFANIFIDLAWIFDKSKLLGVRLHLLPPTPLPQARAWSLLARATTDAPWYWLFCAFQVW